jgi:hypothetical protein
MLWGFDVAAHCFVEFRRRSGGARMPGINLTIMVLFSVTTIIFAYQNLEFVTMQRLASFVQLGGVIALTKAES